MLTIAFTGDVAFSQHFKDAYRPSVVDGEIRSFLQSAQYVVANIEGPVTNRPIDSKWRLNHANPPEAADSLLGMHLNIWNLCNNHVLDCGSDAVFDSTRIAKRHGCIPLGIGSTEDERPKPLIIDGEDCRVGIFSITEDYRNSFTDQKWIVTIDDTLYIQEQIHALKAQVDHIVVVAHGGGEYTSMPLPLERERYMKFLEWGADVIVAHHPHVVQNYERVGNKLIFYSLGNFIFDTPTQRQFRHTDRGILLRLTFSSQREIAWTYLATKIDRETHRVCAIGRTGEGAPAIFQEIGGGEYSLLWPLAAKIDRQNRRKKRELFPTGKARKSRIGSLLWKVKLLGSREKRIALYGRIMAFLRIYRLARRPDIVRYLTDE